jgi:antitoxin ParD1/3/4
MARHTSFVLSEELDGFIREQVKGGEYGSASEVVRDALERLADEKRKEVVLLAALDRGVKSGRARPGVFARVRKRHADR